MADKLFPWGSGTPKYVRVDTANQSSRTVLTVPTGKKVKVVSIYASLQSTATVGNRTMRVLIRHDGTNDSGGSQTMGNQAASLTYLYQWFPGASAVVSGTVQQAPIPDVILPAGAIIIVKDTAAIDAAGDDMITVISYVEYDA